jgi:hypothetical protein
MDLSFFSSFIYWIYLLPETLIQNIDYLFNNLHSNQQLFGWVFILKRIQRLFEYIPHTKGHDYSTEKIQDAI